MLEGLGLFQRARTGEGQRIDVNLFNTAIALQCQELAAFMNLPDRWARSEAGIGGAWLSAPFGVYRTADRNIAIAMESRQDQELVDRFGGTTPNRHVIYRVVTPAGVVVKQTSLVSETTAALYP